MKKIEIEIIDENEYVIEYLIKYNNFEIDFTFDKNEKLYYIVIINKDFIVESFEEIKSIVKNNC